MSLESRNKRALASGQAAWDNALPPEDDGERDYVDGQSWYLLTGNDAEGVSQQDFVSAVAEHVADADDDNIVARILIALRGGCCEYAATLCDKHFDQLMCDTAEELVRKAMEKRNGR